MKKVIMVVLALLMGISIVGCSSTPKEEVVVEPSEAALVEQDESNTEVEQGYLAFLDKIVSEGTPAYGTGINDSGKITSYSYGGFSLNLESDGGYNADTRISYNQNKSTYDKTSGGIWPSIDVFIIFNGKGDFYAGWYYKALTGNVDTIAKADLEQIDMDAYATMYDLPSISNYEHVSNFAQLSGMYTDADVGTMINRNVGEAIANMMADMANIGIDPVKIGFTSYVWPGTVNMTDGKMAQEDVKTLLNSLQIFDYEVSEVWLFDNAAQFAETTNWPEATAEIKENSVFGVLQSRDEFLAFILGFENSQCSSIFRSELPSFDPQSIKN